MKKFEMEENDGKKKKKRLDKEALCERLKSQTYCQECFHANSEQMCNYFAFSVMLILLHKGKYETARLLIEHGATS